MNVSLRVERHRATLGNISGFHLVRPTVSRGGTQDTVISPSSLLLLLVYIQIFRENRERGRLAKEASRYPLSKFPFVFPKFLLIFSNIFWVTFFFLIFKINDRQISRVDKDRAFWGKFDIREFIYFANVTTFRLSIREKMYIFENIHGNVLYFHKITTEGSGRENVVFFCFRKC